MEILSRTKTAGCEVQKEAQKKLGTKCARKLRSRLSDLIAAEAVTELIRDDRTPSKGTALESLLSSRWGKATC